jgi:hypothetical protein
MAALAVLGVLALAPAASSDSFFRFPAEQCVRVSGAAISLNGGRIENADTTQMLSIDCPLFHTNPVSVTLEADITYRDLHPTDVVRCSLTVVRFDGASVVSQQSVMQSEASFVSSEWKKFALPRPGVGRPDAYFVNCKIPPRTANGRSGIGFLETFD